MKIPITVQASLERALAQIALTFLALALLFSAMIVQVSCNTAAFAVERFSSPVDVAPPPPDPRPEYEEVITISSSALDREWDQFWGRSLPLLL